MKSVLLSIKPKYCELIASGQKTVEIRKNRPKIDVPFKVYMYQTRDVLWFYKILEWLKLYQRKVIGEFVCDSIKMLHFVSLEKEMLCAEAREEADYEYCKGTCLSYKEAYNYLKDSKKAYTWHISDLVIYDKPKELSEFYSARKFKDCHRGVQKYDCDYCFDCGLTRPPQSWCYVEELEG